LTGADGATFVLREGDLCYYADEDAISPLWKGQRFPKDICIGGWCMDHQQQVIIEDIYGDERIPYAAYQPTFIKSLAMVPIRTQDPIGAIGNYWATPHRATPAEVELLQALADTTAVAIETVQAHQEIEQRVNAKTEQLQAMNHDLESFAYTLSHDLRSPLTAILGFSNLLLVQYAKTEDQFLTSSLAYIKQGANRINQQIDDVLSLYRLTKKELKCQAVNLSVLAQKILDDLQKAEPERPMEYQLEADLWVLGDPILLVTVLENLLLNAWKYSAKKSLTSIKVGRVLGTEHQDNKMACFFVEDRGAGFDMNYAQNLFQPFQRLHAQNEFVGSGIGLASVKRIVQNHGGKIWAEAEEEQGATFYFSLPCPVSNIDSNIDFNSASSSSS
jgi:signal transduction histidine kinase